MFKIWIEYMHEADPLSQWIYYCKQTKTILLFQNSEIWNDLNPRPRLRFTRE
jgi:hypothetical protein